MKASKKFEKTMRKTEYPAQIEILLFQKHQFDLNQF